MKTLNKLFIKSGTATPYEKRENPHFRLFSYHFEGILSQFNGYQCLTYATL